MFENVCTLPLTSELFTQAIHPNEPIIAVGLSGGHVQSFRLPAPATSISDEEEDGNTSVVSSGTGTVETLWRTRRHKGSCRCLGYSYDAEVLYSAGTDGLLKAASSQTGQVVAKLAIPLSPTSDLDPPTILHALSPQTLLLATDSSALHLYDLRVPSSTFSSSTSKPSQTHHPHDDYISSLSPLPPTANSTSGFSKQWVSTGGTTLAITDLRRGVLVKSEDQEEELLSSVFISGLAARPGRSSGEKVLIGSSSGVLTLWERGVWDDQGERIVVHEGGRGGGESLDALAVVPGDGRGGREVVVGVGDGTARLVRVGGRNGIVDGGILRHDELEGVVGVGFEVGGRLITGGGMIVKVWQEGLDGSDEEEEEGEDESDDDSSGDERSANKKVKRRRGRGSDSSSDDESSEEEEEDEKPRRKKKRKGGNKKAGKAKNLGNGVLGFKGMD